MGAPEPIKRAGLIIETEPEIRSNLEKLYSKSYPAIAKNAMKNFLNPSEHVTISDVNFVNFSRRK